MKKAIFMLAAIGMMAAGAQAQTQRVNRTNTRTTRTTTTTMPATTTTPPATQRTTVISAEENARQQEAAQDGTRFPARGATGVDGTINDRANSGNNNSSTIFPDHGNNPNINNTLTPTTTQPSTTAPATR